MGHGDILQVYRVLFNVFSHSVGESYTFSKEHSERNGGRLTTTNKELSRPRTSVSVFPPRPLLSGSSFVIFCGKRGFMNVCNSQIIKNTTFPCDDSRSRVYIVWRNGLNTMVEFESRSEQKGYTMCSLTDVR